MKKIVFFFFLCTIGILSAQQKEVTLKSYSFEEAYALQEKEPKPMLVFFHTHWCKFCFGMKQNTFSNKKVVELLNDEFYFISFDAESNDKITLHGNVFQNTSGVHQLTENLATKNGTISYPSTVILSPNNTIDAQVATFLSAKELARILSTYLKNTKNVFPKRSQILDTQR